MKKLFLTAVMLLMICSCAGNTTLTPTSNTSAAITSAQDAAEKSLTAIGIALQATPAVLNALYDSGKMSKQDYNNAVPVYNQAVASFKLAVSALSDIKKAGQDPNVSPDYLDALGAFVKDKQNIDNMTSLFSQNKIGSGVEP